MMAKFAIKLEKIYSIPRGRLKI